MVYNTNALHGPYQESSELLEIPKSIEERYGKALYIIDNSLKNLYEGLKESGQLEKTIFIFTSDHGQYAIRRMQRLGSFLKEALQIPIIFRMPSKWIQENPRKYLMLKYNSDKRITNLDLIPTVVDLFGSRVTNQEIYKKYIGTSLFDTITNERMITCLSTNDYRRWTNEGFGLYKDTMSYIVDKTNKEQLYDLDKDSLQYNNIIHNVHENCLHHYKEKVESNHHLKRIYTETVK